MLKEIHGGNFDEVKACLFCALAGICAVCVSGNEGFNVLSVAVVFERRDEASHFNMKQEHFWSNQHFNMRLHCCCYMFIAYEVRLLGYFLHIFLF
jgi:hypothetical protein